MNHSRERFKIVCVVGARPNFVKMAPILRAMRLLPELEPTLVHTGQHYDRAMKDVMFEQLGLPLPEIDLGVGGGTHTTQTAEVMLRFEPVLEHLAPAAVLVVGDVNSTLACALTAVKKNIPVVHVEAGLRSHDRVMPEEINRILTDQISDLLFTTEPTAAINLNAEGIDNSKIRFVGNVMIDNLRQQLPRATPSQTVLRNHGLNVEGYGVVTLHRLSNVDNRFALRNILGTLGEISQHMPLVFPIHPRTRAKMDAAQLDNAIDPAKIILVPPLGYLDMLGLVAGARLVLTDSGGLQEETTALGVPCFTLRENTERPVTISEGTNVLVGIDRQHIMNAFHAFLATGGKRGRNPQLWDGQAAERIARQMLKWLRQRGGASVSYPTGEAVKAVREIEAINW